VGKARPDKRVLLGVVGLQQADQYKKTIGRVERFHATRVCCIFLSAAQIGYIYRAKPTTTSLTTTARWGCWPSVGAKLGTAGYMVAT